MVSVTEIEKNEYNLNIPRYIDSQDEEDIQDIEAHLHGGIPNVNIYALREYWETYPTLRSKLYTPSARKNYSILAINHDDIKKTIYEHSEFIQYTAKVQIVFDTWKKTNHPKLKGIAIGEKPKKLIHTISEDLLQNFSELSLIDKYDMYQHLLSYWMEVMQDDVYELVVDGWACGNEIDKDAKKKHGKAE